MSTRRMVGSLALMAAGGLFGCSSEVIDLGELVREEIEASRQRDREGPVGAYTDASLRDDEVPDIELGEVSDAGIFSGDGSAIATDGGVRVYPGDGSAFATDGGPPIEPPSDGGPLVLAAPEFAPAPDRPSFQVSTTNPAELVPEWTAELPRGAPDAGAGIPSAFAGPDGGAWIVVERWLDGPTRVHQVDADGSFVGAEIALESPVAYEPDSGTPAPLEFTATSDEAGQLAAVLQWRPNAPGYRFELFTTDADSGSARAPLDWPTIHAWHILNSGSTYHARCAGMVTEPDGFTFFTPYQRAGQTRVRQLASDGTTTLERDLYGIARSDSLSDCYDVARTSSGGYAVGVSATLSENEQSGEVAWLGPELEVSARYGVPGGSVLGVAQLADDRLAVHGWDNRLFIVDAEGTYSSFDLTPDQGQSWSIGKVVSDGLDTVYLVANPAPTSQATHGLLCKIETAGVAYCYAVDTWRDLALASDGAVYLADSRTVQRFRVP